MVLRPGPSLSEPRVDSVTDQRLKRHCGRHIHDGSVASICRLYIRLGGMTRSHQKFTLTGIWPCMITNYCGISSTAHRHYYGTGT